MSRYRYSHVEARIRGTLGQMPYGGGREPIRAASRKVGLDDLGRPAPITIEAVADYLEALRDVLEQIVDENRQEHDELTQLRNDVAAVRRLLGIGAS